MGLVFFLKKKQVMCSLFFLCEVESAFFGDSYICNFLAPRLSYLTVSQKISKKETSDFDLLLPPKQKKTFKKIHQVHLPLTPPFFPPTSDHLKNQTNHHQPTTHQPPTTTHPPLPPRSPASRPRSPPSWRSPPARPSFLGGRTAVFGFRKRRGRWPVKHENPWQNPWKTSKNMQKHLETIEKTKVWGDDLLHSITDGMGGSWYRVLCFSLCLLWLLG